MEGIQIYQETKKIQKKIMNPKNQKKMKKILKMEHWKRHKKIKSLTCKNIN